MTEITLEDINEALKVVEDYNKSCPCDVCNKEAPGFCFRSGIIRISEEERDILKKVLE